MKPKNCEVCDLPVDNATTHLEMRKSGRNIATYHGVCYIDWVLNRQHTPLAEADGRGNESGKRD